MLEFLTGGLRECLSSNVDFNATLVLQTMFKAYFVTLCRSNFNTKGAAELFATVVLPDSTRDHTALPLIEYLVQGETKAEKGRGENVRK